MRQFKSYAIYVSGNTLTEKEIEAEIQRRVKDYYRQLKTDSKFRAEINKAKREVGFTNRYAEKLVREQGFDWASEEFKPINDEFRFREVMLPDSSPEAVHYEDIVMKQLERINTTEIGKLFFDSFVSTKQLWITFLEGSEQTECECFATTDNAPVKGYIQIKYPITAPDKGEDILFHEVVHAYRKSRGLEMKMFYNQEGEYIYSEEFVATLFQNIYRSCIGEQQFFRYSKNRMRLLSKKNFYLFLRDNADTLKMLKELILKDPMARKISKWAYPFFNPLRDYSRI